jgi:hypothetical protein
MIALKPCSACHSIERLHHSYGMEPEYQFAADSPLERNGFERSVPRSKQRFRGSSELGRSTGAPVIRAVAGLGIPIAIVGRWSEESPLTAEILTRKNGGHSWSALFCSRGRDGAIPSVSTADRSRVAVTALLQRRYTVRDNVRECADEA